jgi:hypothetical protein
MPMDDGRQETFVDHVNGLEFTYYAFTVVDGVVYMRTPGETTVRPMIQLLSDRPGKGEYKPIAYRRGEVCEQCWLKFRHIHGNRDSCPTANLGKTHQ